jgi:hypothetical protein
MPFSFYICIGTIYAPLQRAADLFCLAFFFNIIYYFGGLDLII